MKKDMIRFAILLMVALSAAPAYSAWWQWSKTAASNASADPSINFAEGMAPSAVNDSARALMARAAEFRDDTSGLLVTAGSSTAYTVATNQGLASVPNDGQLLSVTVHATNGAAPTLQADSGTVYPIQSSPGSAVASGTLILGSPYMMKFSTSNSAWMLMGFYSSATNIPLGGMMQYTLNSAPNSNFVLAQGQCLSTTTYAAYWVALGSPASGSCSGGNFRILDLSGRIPAGLDNGTGRLTSSGTGCGTAMTSVGAVCANGSESRSIGVGNVPSITSIQNGLTVNVQSALNVIQGGTTGQTQTTGAFIAYNNPSNFGVISSTGTINISAVSSGTSGTALPAIQPTIAVNYLLRVL